MDPDVTWPPKISRDNGLLHTQLADNVTNIIGIILGTLFRFWSYRKWVFAANLEEPLPDPAQLEPLSETSGLEPSDKG